MRSRDGRTRDCQPKRSGKSRPGLRRYRAISSIPKYCIPHLPGARLIRSNSSETFGNGPPVLTLRTPGTNRGPARLASTTANSCAINMCCAEDPALLRARTYAQLIETSSHPKSGGNSQESAWRETHELRLQNPDVCRE